MPTITKSIGTASRDYSTITLWEADLDNGAVYASGDAAVGECYNDSAFDESVTINGGGTVGLASVTLTVAAGERHDGTAGTGARIVLTSGTTTCSMPADGIPKTLSWLELTHTPTISGSMVVVTVSLATDPLIIKNCLLHRNHNTGSGGPIILLLATANTVRYVVVNNIVYDAFHDNAGASAALAGINAANAKAGTVYANNTIHNIRTTGSGSVSGITVGSDADIAVQNTLVTDVSTTGAGAATDYSLGASAVRDHNASEDATADGTGSLTSIVAADQYVSTVVGSEDLHLKSGADCIDAGVDLGTTPTGVNIDINGRDRDAEGDVWDIGAHEFVAAAAAGNPWYYYAQQ